MFLWIIIQTLQFMQQWTGCLNTQQSLWIILNSRKSNSWCLFGKEIHVQYMLCICINSLVESHTVQHTWACHTQVDFVAFHHSKLELNVAVYMTECMCTELPSQQPVVCGWCIIVDINISSHAHIMVYIKVDCMFLLFL